MNNPKIEVDIASILNKLETKLDKLSEEIKTDQKKLLEEVNNLKLGQVRIEGKLEILDTKVEQLDKRVANQEFLNRGVFIGLLLALLSGLINFLGLMPKK